MLVTVILLSGAVLGLSIYFATIFMFILACVYSFGRLLSPFIRMSSPPLAWWARLRVQTQFTCSYQAFFGSVCPSSLPHVVLRQLTRDTSIGSMVLVGFLEYFPCHH